MPGPPTLTALASDTVDLAEIGPGDVEAAEGQGLVVVTGRNPDAVASTFYLCTSKPPFDDVRVRQAFSKALDRQQLLDAVYSGYGTASELFLIPDSPFYPEDADELAAQLAYDPDGARALIQEAGVDGAGIVYMVQANPPSVALGEVVQSMLAEVGLTATLEQSQYVLNDSLERVPELTGGGGTSSNLTNSSPGFDINGITNRCKHDPGLVGEKWLEARRVTASDDEVKESFGEFSAALVADPVHRAVRPDRRGARPPAQGAGPGRHRHAVLVSRAAGARRRLPDGVADGLRKLPLATRASPARRRPPPRAATTAGHA